TSSHRPSDPPPRGADLMPVVTRCLHCKQLAQVADSFADKLVRCPNCQQVFMARRDSGEPPTHLSAAPPSNGSAVAARPKPAPSAIRPAQPATALGQCPVCKAKLPPGATSCGECGWVRQDTAIAGAL